MPSKIINFILKHKVAAIIIIILAVVVGYFANKTLSGQQAETRYVLSKVEKGTIITSVSGSGQVSTLNQVDIKPKVSGDVVYVGVENGQEVKTGALLAQINTNDAQKSVRDAETSLETAELELEELLSPPDELTLLQAENSLTQAKESKQTAEDNIVKAYEDGFNNISNAFLDLPTIMAGLQDILYTYSFRSSQQNIDYYADTAKVYDTKATQYRTDADSKYQTARTAYDKNFLDYKSASRLSSTAVIESLINETYETTRAIAEAVKSANNLIQFYADKLAERNLKRQALADTHLSSLTTYTSKTNSYLSSILSAKSSIQNNRESIVDAGRTIQEKELSLANLKAGADEFDIRAKKIAIQQKKDALLDAQQNLADCYIRAPFDGIITEVNVKKGDSISSGTAVATLITKQKIAEVTLNEIDAAKVKAGQKTTLAFDALPELSVTGKVLEIDTVGTVSQGVVNYGVKIGFDTEEEQIKPGMSVTVDIITEVKQDVLLIPISAVKTTGNNSFAEILVDNQPQKKAITTGSSNDTMIEVIEGLTEGEQVVAQTTTNGSSTGQSTNDRQNGDPQNNQMRGIFQMMR